MAVNKRLLIGAFVVLVILASGLFVWHERESKPMPSPSQSVETQQKASTPASPVTAGGQPVPTSSQQKARAEGHYCPSWDAKPGQISPDICYSLDH